MKTHRKTKTILNQLGPGESLVITRNGRASGRSELRAAAGPPGWDQIMGEVWREQKRVNAAGRVPNPVLRERQRRRR